MSARRPVRRGRAYAAVVAALLAALVASAASWGQEARLRPPFARESALGGTHAALADDLSTIFANPAGFRAAGPELSLAELTVGIAGPVFDVANIAAQAAGGGAIEDIVSSPEVQELLQGLRASVGLAGPVAFGYVGNGLGFGIFNGSDVELSSIGVVPTLSAAVRETFTVCGGYAFRIPLGSGGHYLDIGALLKAFVRGEISMTRDLVGLLGVFQDPSMDIVLGGPFTLDVGAGVDVGIRYSWAERLSVGIVARDAYTPYLRNTYDTTQSLLDGLAPSSRAYRLRPLDLSAGVAFRPALGRLDRVVTDLAILGDYVDILDFVLQPATARNPVLHAGLGIEVVLLDVLALRGGFSQGLFAAGLGIDLSFFTMNLSMYGQEMSTEPGLAPAYSITLGLEFRL